MVAGVLLLVIVGVVILVILALVLGAFLLAERGRWLGAGTITGLAVLTRISGVALLPALALLAWRQPERRRLPDRLWRSWACTCRSSRSRSGRPFTCCVQPSPPAAAPPLSLGIDGEDGASVVGRAGR